MDLPLPDAGQWLLRCPIDDMNLAAINRAIAGQPQPDDPAGAPWQVRPSLHGFVDFNHVSRPHQVGAGRHHTDKVGEARAVFDAPSAGPATLTLSWDERMVIRLNDQAPENLGDNRFFRTRQSPVDLKAGANELHVTLRNHSGSNHGGRAFACMLETADGELLKPHAPKP